MSDAKCWATCASRGSISSAIAARSIANATARRTATSSNGGIATLNDANERNTVPVVVWISGRSEGSSWYRSRTGGGGTSSNTRSRSPSSIDRKSSSASSHTNSIRSGSARRSGSSSGRHDGLRTRVIDPNSSVGKPSFSGPIRDGVNPLAGVAFRGRERGVHVLRALEHVRAGCHHHPAVSAGTAEPDRFVVAGRDAERSVGSAGRGRDRRAHREREQVEQSGIGSRGDDPEREGVGGLQPHDRRCVALGVVDEAVDQIEVAGE